MNKRILTVAVAALALAACSENETVEVATNRAIGFENFVDKATRAEMTTTELQTTGFVVFGGSEDTKDLFNDVDVTYNNGWTYTDTKYWMYNKTYKFAAYAPINDAITTEAENAWDYTNNNLTFTVKTDENAQLDVVYDEAAEVVVEDELPTAPVAFTFEHIMSKLNFVIKRGADIETDATLVIKGGVKVAGTVNMQGTYNGTAWTPTSETATTFNGVTTDVNIDNTAGSGNIGTLYVIPQQLANADGIKVTFTAALMVDDQQIGTDTELTATISGAINWQQGYVYTYTAEINQSNIEGGNPIEFTGTVSANWTDGGDGTMALD